MAAVEKHIICFADLPVIRSQSVQIVFTAIEVQKKVEMIKLRINYEVEVQCQDEGFTIEDCQNVAWRIVRRPGHRRWMITVVIFLWEVFSK